MLNFLFQSAAAVIFKTAMCYINNRLDDQGLWFKQLIAYHDEVQLEICKEDAVEIQTVVEQSWIDAGEYWAITCPTTGESKVGGSWAECH